MKQMSSSSGERTACPPCAGASRVNARPARTGGAFAAANFSLALAVDLSWQDRSL